ncbi:hypothetical protein HO173_006393 [Letharia columbiana]|uniref:FAD-binding domain-containing protein n=1 Tax=Letharia columbiana TaxID=112416 RepID=A0A8H6L4I1_9LECA|nr:uncharacterized protein HO173_006393 [Letharia columbiana]KAF6235199.1 hypothetical protein HO173_006393 [Letharia columbiana]
MTPITTQQPILILGAGISGLALAQGLLKSNIPFRIYERDTHFNLRAQGYRVRIIGPGIEALQSVLSSKLYQRLEASCATNALGGSGPSARLNALSAEELESFFGKAGPPGMGGQPGPGGPGKSGPGMSMGQKPEGSPEPLNADRMVLRSVLMRGLEEHVEFGKEFSAYEITPSGVVLHFSDASEAQGSLLVGADGASSRVRKQFVPQLSLMDTEGRFFYGKSTLTPELEEKFNERCLKGMAVIQDRTGDVPVTLLLEPVRFKDNEFRKELPKDYVYWVLLARKGVHGMTDAELLGLTNNESAELAKKLTSHWHPSFHALLDQQDSAQTSLLRIISASPNIPIWEPSSRITLIGDAAHVMSPTAGIGATCALRDAAMLAEVLRDEGITKEAVGRYEEFMRQNAQEGISRSAMGGKHMFGMRPFEELAKVTV